MLAFSVFFFIVASFLVESNAAITRPGKVLEQIDEIQASIATYRASVQEQIRAFRTSTEDNADGYFNQTLNVFVEGLANISATNDAIRTKLNAETQGACITNLNNYVDSIIELSGYAISNCIEVDEDSTLKWSLEFIALLDAFEKEVNSLHAIVINALIGRNIFTQGDEIITRIQDQLNAKSEEYKTKIDELTAKAGEFEDVAVGNIDSFRSCTCGADASVQTGTAFVESQFPSCARFGTRGARSALPDPKTFFTQL